MTEHRVPSPILLPLLAAAISLCPLTACGSKEPVDSDLAIVVDRGKPSPEPSEPEPTAPAVEPDEATGGRGGSGGMPAPAGAGRRAPLAGAGGSAASKPAPMPPMSIDDAGAGGSPASVPEPDFEAADPCGFEAAPDADYSTQNTRCPDGVYRGAVVLSDAPESFAALKDCVRLEGDLTVSALLRTDLSGLETLRVITGDLSVLADCGDDGCEALPALTSLKGLDQLRCVRGDVSVGRDASFELKELDGLGELQEIGGSLYVKVPALKSPEALGSLKRVWGDVDCMGPLPLRALETVYGRVEPSPLMAPNLTYIGCEETDPCRDGYLGCDLTVRDQAALERLENCQETRLDLTVSGADIRDLSPLHKLVHVGGTLSIGPEVGVGRLSSLRGLEALRHASAFELRNLPELAEVTPLQGFTLGSEGELALTQLNGLRSLTGLEAAHWTVLTLFGNTGLSSLAGLSAQARAARVELVHNPELSTIAALEPLERAISIKLAELPALSSLQGLAHLEQLDSLDVSSCDALVDLTGLERLKKLGTLGLRANAGLSDLSALSALTNVDHLTIADNPKLPQCEIDRLVTRFPMLLTRPSAGTNGPAGTCATP